MSNGFIYVVVVDAHFIHKIKKKISWTLVPASETCYVENINSTNFIFVQTQNP